jgi:membrane associated rhomboid family serine protease/Flp pilus assembly protein TadD
LKKICQWCVQHEAAQRREDTDEVKQRVMPAPWVQRESTITLTHIIFGANVAVFLAMALAGGSVMDFSSPVMVNFGANFGPYTLSGEWWRLLTYMFLHGGLFHVAINMWCLWSFGTLCESLYGRWTYASIYLITGVAGGLTSIAWNPRVLSVGASGALFGLTGALMASIYLGEFSLSGISLRGTLGSLVFFAGFSLYFGFVSSGIDNGAHIGGLVSGLILGALIARIAPENDHRRVAVLGVVALMVLSAGLFVRQWRGGSMRMARAFQEARGNPVAQMQVIVRAQPNSPQAHFELAQAYFNQQQFPQAEAEFKRVLELQPQNMGARFDLGMTYLSEKRPDEASATFKQMLAQDANSADGHYGLGLVLAGQGNYQAAIEEFKAAAERGPSISGIYYEMGNSYGKLKMYDDAIASYLKEKEKNGDDPDVELALANAYQAKGMTRQAQEAKGRAERLKGGHQDQ